MILRYIGRGGLQKTRRVVLSAWARELDGRCFRGRAVSCQFSSVSRPETHDSAFECNSKETADREKNRQNCNHYEVCQRGIFTTG